VGSKSHRALEKPSKSTCAVACHDDLSLLRMLPHMNLRELTVGELLAL
jgi:hypothetical protein